MRHALLLTILSGLILGAAGEDAAGWLRAQPGWKFEWPRDHAAHPDFKTEWWYFTGN